MFTRPFMLRASLFAAVASVVTIVSLGGCPVAQTPSVPNENTVDLDSDRSNGGNNQRFGSRPVPPIPQDDTGGGPTTPDTTGGGPTDDNTNDNGDDGGSQAVRVVITSPLVAREVTRNASVEVKYRVDGEPAAVELVYTRDNDPTVVTVQSGLNVEGTVNFTSDTPGVYKLGIRALDLENRESVQYAPGLVTVVGDIQLVITQPANSLIVRPNVPVAVAYTVTTLAKSVNVRIGVDPDRNVDGDEIEAFTSTQKNGSDAIETQGLQLGVTYSIFAEVTDSVAQSTGRIYHTKTFKIVPAPTVQVFEPSTDATIEIGDPVTVTFQGADTEGQSEMTVFVDTDGVFNGDEDPIGPNLPLTDTSFVVDTSNFVPGVYHFGVWISDTASGDIFDHEYADGIQSIPGINLTAPTADVSVRAPTAVRVSWTAIYPAAQFPTHQLIRAEDFNNDEQPDGNVTVVQSGFSPGNNSVDMSTVGMSGRYLVGVRIIDNSGSPRLKFAPGQIIVDNDVPTVSIDFPDLFLGVRPNTAGARIPMVFTINDTERRLSNPGIEVVVARDDDVDGNPDGDPVLAVSSAQLRIGLNFFTFDATQIDTAGLISDPVHDRFGMFLLGVRVTDDAGQTAIDYVEQGLYVDAVEPTITLDDPAESLVKDRIGTLSISATVTDTSPTAAAVLLDPDTNLNNGNEIELAADLLGPNGVLDATIDLSTVEAGFYWIHMFVFDGAELPVQHYLPPDETDPRQMRTLWVRDRLIGRIYVADFLNPNDDRGAILQGFNFNDLAGASMTRVPDVDGDGDDEFTIVSRYGKPFIINNTIGVGFGEGYMIYGNGGNGQRDPAFPLRGAQSLNAVGSGSIRGLAFPGMRIPLNASATTTGMTEGIADVTVVPDMDGDRLPEIVFAFPRAEAIHLGETVNTVQHPDLVPDLPGMGNLEYDAYYGAPPSWHINESQFTRGGIVIVSSHNTSVQQSNILNRKSDRVIDLHEVGQMFSSMSRPSLKRYIAAISPDNPPGGTECCPADPDSDCDQDGRPDATQPQDYEAWIVAWDVVFNWDGDGPAHGPGGFHQPWTSVPANPPLANPSLHPPLPPYPFYPDLGPCDVPGCKVTNVPYVWPPQPLGTFPCSQRNNVLMWDVGGGVSHWTGFYGANPDVSILPLTIGARVLGQDLNDRFGTSVSADNTWLYISAPRHTAKRTDVPRLPSATRTNSGVVYQYRVDTGLTPGGRSRSQLWMEPGGVDSDGDGTIDDTTRWPTVDVDGVKGADVTMPVPHQYLIETVGSTRGNPPGGEYNYTGSCPPPFEAGFGGAQADAAGGCYQPYPVGTAGYYMERTPQIVGPHAEAKISHVASLGDVNDDGIVDFAVGSPYITTETQNWPNSNGTQVGAIFIVFGKETGLEGDYLLEELALAPSDDRRLHGVLIKGTVAEPIARVFDGIGKRDANGNGTVEDFNGDGVADVIIGSRSSAGSRGIAIVVLGSRTLESPQGGYDVGTIQTVLNNPITDPNDPDYDRYIEYKSRFIVLLGANTGDLAGTNVAAAGDVDGDNIGDILITAPGAADPLNSSRRPGVTYLIYGSSVYGDTASNVIDLGQTGTPSLPGVLFVGRFNNGPVPCSNGQQVIAAGLGGGEMQIAVNPGANPSDCANKANWTQIASEGAAELGDINGDGLIDYAISDMIANPNNRNRAGEVYVIYGRGDRPPP